HSLLPANPPRELRFDDALTSARIEATSGRAAAARSRTAALVAEADKAGLLSFAFDARLAQAEIAALGGDEAAPALRASLNRDASAAGFLLISQKAKKRAAEIADKAESAEKRQCVAAALWIDRLSSPRWASASSRQAVP